MTFSPSINCKFHFHPVGQGLFHSGHIGQFTFVYDCGGKKDYVAKEIHDLPNKPIDLLIISHLHADHTSGISQLIKHCGLLKDVVLPYMQPEEILLIGTEYLLNDRERTNTDEFILLLANPQAFFGESTRITYIVNKEGSDERSRQAESTTFTWPNASHVKERSHCDTFQNCYYSFKFFHQPIPEDLLESFKTELTNRKIDTGKLQECLEKKAEDLKEAYKKVVGKQHLNRTSLVCLHRTLYKSCPCDGSFPFCYADIIDSCGTLLTGDANFNECLEPFTKHYSSTERESVCTALVPHHGSRHNWTHQLFTTLPNTGVWICSCGVRNRYQHPHHKVLLDFFKSHHSLIACTEMTSGFNYQLTI